MPIYLIKDFLKEKLNFLSLNLNREKIKRRLQREISRKYLNNKKGDKQIG